MNVRTNPMQPSQRLIWWSGLLVAGAFAVGGYLANFISEGTIAGIIVLFGILFFRDRQTRLKLSVSGRIVENSTTVLYRLATDPSLPMTFISSNIRKLGYDPSQFLTSPDFYRGLVHPDDQASVAEFTQRLLYGGGADSLQFRVRASDGSYRWFDNQVTPLRSKAGDLVALEGMLIDTTERRHAEEKIRENEATIHGLVEQSLVGVFIADEAGKLVYQWLLRFIRDGEPKFLTKAELRVAPRDDTGIKTYFKRGSSHPRFSSRWRGTRKAIVGHFAGQNRSDSEK